MAASSLSSDASAPAQQPEVHIEPRRVLAVLIDTLIILFLSEIVNRLIFPLRLSSPSVSAAHGKVTLEFIKPTVAVWPWGVLFTSVYFAILESAFGVSAGKALMRLRVVRRDGRRVSVGGAIVRNLFRPVDFAPFLYIFGAISVYLSPVRQRLGDRVANSLVASKDSVPLAALDRRARQVGALICAVALAAIAVFCGLIAHSGQSALVVDQGSSSTGLASYVYSVTTSVPNAKAVTFIQLSGPTGQNGILNYRIRYDVVVKTTTVHCGGTIQLRWGGIVSAGWQVSSLAVTCPSPHDASG